MMEAYHSCSCHFNEPASIFYIHVEPLQTFKIEEKANQREYDMSSETNLLLGLANILDNFVETLDELYYLLGEELRIAGVSRRDVIVVLVLDNEAVRAETKRLVSVAHYELNVVVLNREEKGRGGSQGEQQRLTVPG